LKLLKRNEQKFFNFISIRTTTTTTTTTKTKKERTKKKRRVKMDKLNMQKLMENKKALVIVVIVIIVLFVVILALAIGLGVGLNKNDDNYQRNQTNYTIYANRTNHSMDMYPVKPFNVTALPVFPLPINPVNSAKLADIDTIIQKMILRRRNNH
jgi:hypothetical protein